MKYLVAIHHPDDYDPAAREDEAMSRDIDALNEEMEAAGAGFLPADCTRRAARSRYGRNPVVRCSSPTDRTWKPKSTSAASGFWKPLTWMRHWRGGEKPSSPAGHR